MTQSLIVLAIVLIAAAFWARRLFPAHVAKARTALGLGQGPTDAKGCDRCSNCKGGGGCH